MRLLSFLVLAICTVGASAQDEPSQEVDKSLCSADVAREPPSAMSEAELEKIRELNTLLVNGVQKVTLDYSSESIQWLDATITRKRENLEDQGLARSAMLFGSYLGEAIVRRYNGEWVLVGQEPAVLVNEKTLLFPMGQVLNHIQQGERCSIYEYYTQLPALLGEER